MEYKTITFKRIKNQGNFESEHLEVSAEVDKDEDVDTVIKSLKAKVYRGLGLEKSKSIDNDAIDF